MSPNSIWILKSQRSAKAWIDQQNPLTTESTSIQWELNKVSDGYRTDWQDRIKAHKIRLEQLSPKIEELMTEMSRADQLDNPLRDPVEVETISKTLGLLESQAAQIRKDINEMLVGVSERKEALLNAKQRDEQKIRQTTGRVQIESQMLSTMLLHKMHGEMIADAVHWFKTLREQIPSDQRQPRQRGVDVQFGSQKQKPNFLIRDLQIKGEGRFANQHLNFAGHAHNFTNQPQISDLPISVELRAQGSQHLIINSVIDRRSPNAIDSIEFQCPSLSIPAQSLGHPDTLLVSLGEGSTVNAQIRLRAEGDQLSGSFHFQHAGSSMHVDQIGGFLGGRETALRLNQDLAGIGSFNSESTISGTISNFDYTLDSDLGIQFCTALNRIAMQQSENTVQAQKSSLESKLQSEIQVLENQIARELEYLAAKLEQNRLQIAELQQSIKNSPSPWPAIRR